MTVKRETVKDIKDYALLKLKLKCSECELKQWERIRQSSKDLEIKDDNISGEQVKHFRQEQAGILERMQAAEEAVLSLPDNLKETLWYLCIEGWEPARVANMMNCKLSVIERRRKEGLQALRDSSGK